MARRPLLRLLALVLLATFGFAQVGRAHTHQCPTHDGAVPATTSHHATGHGEPAGAAEQEQEHQQCNCLGECCTSAVATRVDADAHLTLATSFNSESRFHSSDCCVPRNPAHRLPPATGPPSPVSIA